jgi:hypothetical protein
MAIHFLHAKAPQRSNSNSKPTIPLLYGWPGSFWEFS